MKKYETYKESGLEWLDCVPEHWETIKIKYLFSFGRGLNITKADLVEEGSPVISYGQIHSKSNTGVSITDELLRFVPMETASAHPENKVHKGDFIFADTSEDKEGCGNCVYIDREGIYAGYHSLVLDGKGRNNKYLAYLFKSEPWRIQIRSKASGVKVFSITQSIMGESTVILPPLSEQLTIASYLDYKVSQIDVLIAEKEKMVADLKAYRSSVITEAVTKGLDKNAEMKESGVEWIGETPQKWTVTKLKYFISISSGEALSNENINNTGKYPVFGGGERIGFYDFANTSSEELIVGRVGARCGCVTMPRCSCWATDNALKIKTTMLLEYIYFSLTAANLNSLNNSNAQPLITSTTIKNINVSLPSIEEQKNIALYLLRKTSRIDVVIEEIEYEISDLKSYKSSLITEAITGKIDLRGWEQQKE